MVGIPVGFFVAVDGDGTACLWMHQAPVWDDWQDKFVQHLRRPFSPNRICVLSAEMLDSLGLTLRPGDCVAVNAFLERLIV